MATWWDVIALGLIMRLLNSLSPRTKALFARGVLGEVRAGGWAAPQTDAVITSGDVCCRRSDDIVIGMR